MIPDFELIFDSRNHVVIASGPLVPHIPLRPHVSRFSQTCRALGCKLENASQMLAQARPFRAFPTTFSSFAFYELIFLGTTPPIWHGCE
jgi:hypothetical protein